MRWRWDQGRLEYFKFDSIVAIAKVLCELEGVHLNSKTDLLRSPLETQTGLPFAPSHYKVWRNYARVFQCSMLATSVANKLVTTDICKKIIDNEKPLMPDEYLNFVFSHFLLPFPAFDDYCVKGPVTYPFISIIKFLMARYESGCTLDDLFAYVVGNNCSGLEGLDHYCHLKATTRKPLGDEKRQVREMLSFMGQVSYLKWFDKRIFIDSSDFNSILKAVSPFTRGRRRQDAHEEFFSLTSLPHNIPAKFDIVLNDRIITPFSVREGGKTFVTHGKLERSPLVRKKFFEKEPLVKCDACLMKTQERYPWTNNILELHHILPLSATLNVNGTTTVLDDLVPLCPSCHKSIHIFYRLKLNEWDVLDFSSKKMAKDVYAMAKGAIRV